jgi:hypothetical protein
MNKQKYYVDVSNYPDQIKSIVTRMKIYMCTELYYEEAIVNSISKCIYADISNGGSDEGIRRATQLFKSTNQTYPFTAYDFGDEELLNEKRTAYAKNMIFFDPYIGEYVSAKPAIFNMPMISFYNRPEDYQVAKKILFKIASRPIQLDVPIIIGNVTTTFPIRVTFEAVDKGTYAFNFQEQLRAGDIYDIQHFARIEYHDMETTSTGVYPVEDMIFELFRLAEEDISLSESLYTTNNNTITTLSSSTPANGATDVAVDTTVALTFTVAMYEQSVEDALDLDPFFSANYSWNDSSTIFTIEPVVNLTSGTVYNVTIEDTAYSFANHDPLSGEISITFITV